jgi:aspartyl protease family protein
MRKLLVMIVLVAFAALLLVLHAAFPAALSSDQSRLQLVSSIGWLVLVVGSVALRFHSQPGNALRAMAAWLLAALLLIAAYAYRFEAQEVGQRMLAVVLPSRGMTAASGSIDGAASGDVRFALNAEGHYQIDAAVNGQPVSFLVDTGASDIVLTPEDAQRIGFAANQLRFSDRVETANGIAYVAPITLDTLVIGPIRLDRLPAKVNNAPMQYSLLGMRFLNQLHGWRVERQVLILQP